MSKQITKRLPPIEVLTNFFELSCTGSGLVWKNTVSKRYKPGTHAGCMTGPKGKKERWLVGLLGKYYFAHRIVWAIFNKKQPPIDMQIDHIDGNALNNDPCNLRLADYVLNQRNSKIKRSKTSSGWKGVSWDNRRGKWMARITMNKKAKFLGYFDSIESAISARIDAENVYWGTSDNLLLNNLENGFGR